MSSNRSSVFASLLALSALATGCAPQQVAAPPVASAHPTTSTASATPPQTVGGERHVHRLDFVLTGTDGTTPPTSTAFTLNLEEFEKGEMVVGKNMPLTQSTASSSGPAPSVATARHDVGMKVAARYRMTGDDLLLVVETEMSAFEPPSSVRKVVAKGNALASIGKSSLVTTLESDNKKYQLTVTPTKLR
jgi:hypothetical protein